jgi:hypothetical protein
LVDDRLSRSTASLRRLPNAPLAELPPDELPARSRDSLRRLERPPNVELPEPEFEGDDPLRSRNPPNELERPGEESKDRRGASELRVDDRDGPLSAERLLDVERRESSLESRGSRAAAQLTPSTMTKLSGNRVLVEA